MRCRVVINDEESFRGLFFGFIIRGGFMLLKWKKIFEDSKIKKCFMINLFIF